MPSNTSPDFFKLKNFGFMNFLDYIQDKHPISKICIFKLIAHADNKPKGSNNDADDTNCHLVVKNKGSYCEKEKVEIDVKGDN